MSGVRRGWWGSGLRGRDGGEGGRERLRVRRTEAGWDRWIRVWGVSGSVSVVVVVVAMVCVKVKRAGRLHQFGSFIFRSVERLPLLGRGKSSSVVSVLCFSE